MTKDGLVKYQLIKRTFIKRSTRFICCDFRFTKDSMFWFTLLTPICISLRRLTSWFQFSSKKKVFRCARMLNNYTCRNVIPTEWVSDTCYSVLSLTVSLAVIHRSATRPTTALWLMSYATPSRRLLNPLRLFRPWFS